MRNRNISHQRRESKNFLKFSYWTGRHVSEIFVVRGYRDKNTICSYFEHLWIKVKPCSVMYQNEVLGNWSWYLHQISLLIVDTSLKRSVCARNRNIVIIQSYNLAFLANSLGQRSCEIHRVIVTSWFAPKSLRNGASWQIFGASWQIQIFIQASGWIHLW